MILQVAQLLSRRSLHGGTECLIELGIVLHDYNFIDRFSRLNAIFEIIIIQNNLTNLSSGTFVCVFRQDRYSQKVLFRSMVDTGAIDHTTMVHCVGATDRLLDRIKVVLCRLVIVGSIQLNVYKFAYENLPATSENANDRVSQACSRCSSDQFTVSTTLPRFRLVPLILPQLRFEG